MECISGFPTMAPTTRSCLRHLEHLHRKTHLRLRQRHSNRISAAFHQGIRIPNMMYPAPLPKDHHNKIVSPDHQQTLVQDLLAGIPLRIPTSQGCPKAYLIQPHSRLEPRRRNRRLTIAPDLPTNPTSNPSRVPTGGNFRLQDGSQERIQIHPTTLDLLVTTADLADTTSTKHPRTAM